MLKIIRTIFMIGILSIVSFQIIYVPSVYAEGIESITDKPGGGTGNTGNADEGGSSTSTIIIVGAVIIGALLFWKFFIQKPDKDSDKGKKEETDTKKNETVLNKKQLSVSDEIKIVQEKIPVNIFMGINQNDFNMSDQTIVMGVSLSF